MSSAANTREASLSRSLQRHQGYEIADIGMEYLLVGCICRITNPSFLISMTDCEVFDM